MNMKMKNKITYGKNVYDNREIIAVVKTLKKLTQMGKSINDFKILKKVNVIYNEFMIDYTKVILKFIKIKKNSI
jgi:hypothetical protein